MSQSPPATWFTVGFSVIALLAVGLVLLALFAVVTVMLAARRPIVPFQQIKSVAATLLWIVPALAVVGLIGMKFSAARVTTYHHPGNFSEFASGIRDEVRSTVRQAVDQASVTIRQVNGQAVEQSTPIVAEAESTVAGVPPAVKVTINRVADDSSAGERALQRAKSRAASAEGAVNLPSSTGFLRARETRVGAPDWAGKDPVPGDRGILVSLSSQRFATLEEAEQQVTAMAVSYLKEFYQDEYPLSGDWTVPVEVIEKNAVHSLIAEKLNKDFGNGFQGTMYIAHLQLELNSAMRNALHDSWRGRIVTHRLTVLGSMLGLVTLMLATSAGYFRLDDLTGGMYRRRLRFAAASLIAAGSLVALVVS